MKNEKLSLLDKNNNKYNVTLALGGRGCRKVAGEGALKEKYPRNPPSSVLWTPSPSWGEGNNGFTRPSSFRSVSVRNIGAALYPRQKPSGMTNTAKGFTLIELLIVVLIIGILASVALPQYQKAVWKSRAAKLLVRTRALQQAQHVYFLENNAYAIKFADLDIQFDTIPLTSSINCNFTRQDVLPFGNNLSAIVIPENTITSRGTIFNLFLEGSYACAGYAYIPSTYQINGVTPDAIYCVERDAAPFQGKRGDFCKKVLGGTLAGSIWRWSFYKLP